MNTQKRSNLLRIFPNSQLVHQILTKFLTSLKKLVKDGKFSLKKLVTVTLFFFVATKKAIRISTYGRPGSVYLDLPGDMVNHQTSLFAIK